MDRRLTRRAPVAGARSGLSGAAVFGFALGAWVSFVANMPAAWLSLGIANLSQQRIQLLQPQGTLWNGQARLALGAGADSPSVMALSGRLHWRLTGVWDSEIGPALALTIGHPGVLSGEARVLIAPGWNRSTVTLLPGDSGTAMQAHVPASWLSGLGAPWNTLQPSGRLALQIDSLRWERSRGGVSGLQTELKVHLLNIGSRVATLPVLGHYEFEVHGGPELSMQLSSRPGSALVLDGQGRWTPGSRVEFRGQATAAPGREEALSNLLNIIGRRDGTRSIISLGS